MPSTLAARSHRRPLWLGLALAPLAPVFLVYAFFMAQYLTDNDHAPWYEWITALWFVLLYGAPIAYAVMLLLGWPYLAALRRIGWLLVVPVLAGATLLGALGLAAFFALNDMRADGLMTFVGAVLGFAAGASFCLVCGVGWFRPARNARR